MGRSPQTKVQSQGDDNVMWGVLREGMLYIPNRLWIFAFESHTHPVVQERDRGRREGGQVTFALRRILPPRKPWASELRLSLIISPGVASLQQHTQDSLEQSSNQPKAAQQEQVPQSAPTDSEARLFL